jgi:hypothetical protein
MSVKYVNSGFSVEEFSFLHERNSPQRRTPEVFDWQYRSESAPGSTLFVALDEQDGILGSQGAIFYKLLFNGKVIESFKSEATLIEKEYRNKVDFLTLYQTAIDHITERKAQIFWAITPIPKLFKAFGFKDFGRIYTTGILPLSIHGLSNLYLGTDDKNKNKLFIWRVASLIFFFVSFMIFRLSTIFAKLPKDIICCHELKDNNDILSLHSKLNSIYTDQIFLYQDNETIKWRVDGNPVKKTNKFFLYKNDELAGYCYAQENDKNLEILEMAFIDNSLITPLLKMVVLEYKKQFSSLIIMLNSENEIAKIIENKLKLSGFYFIRNRSSFIAKFINKDLKKLCGSPKNWYLSGLWREGV